MSFSASARTVADVFNQISSGEMMTADEIALRIGREAHTVKAAIHILRNTLKGDPLVTTRDHRYGFTGDFHVIDEWENRNLLHAVTRAHTTGFVDSNARAIGFRSDIFDIDMPKPLAIEAAKAA